MKYFLLFFLLIFANSALFAQQTELDSLKQKVDELQKRVEKLEKFQGPGFSDNYFDDISHAFIVIGYHQGSYKYADSLSSINNYGFTLQYAEDNISVLVNAGWGDSKFFSSFYIGYNFYGTNDRIAITPLIGGTSYGDNFLDVQKTIWSFGVSLTGMSSIPISVALFKNEAGFSFNAGYRFDLKDIL